MSSRPLVANTHHHSSYSAVSNHDEDEHHQTHPPHPPHPHSTTASHPPSLSPTIIQNHSHGSTSPVSSPRVCGGLGKKSKRPVQAIHAPSSSKIDLSRLSQSPQSSSSASSTADIENAAARSKLWFVSVLCLCFMVLEITGGIWANSLAILTDAAHLLSDLASFLISIFALWLATRAPTSRLSFGFHRAEILGALVSVVLIWLLTGVLIYEAIQRFWKPEEVNGKLMFFVALAGLGVNIVMGIILSQTGHSHSQANSNSTHSHSHGEGKNKSNHEHTSFSSQLPASSSNSFVSIKVANYQSASPKLSSSHGHSHGEEEHGDEQHSKVANINVSAAYIHVLGDAIQSVGVMIAAAIIWYDPKYTVADPICTFLFSLLVLFTTARLVKQSVGVLMEGAPDGIDPVKVEVALHKIAGVIEVHDLHIWSLSVGKPSLSVHLLTSDENEGATRLVLQRATQMIGRKFNIHHSTIQIEKISDVMNCNDHFSQILEPKTA